MTKEAWFDSCRARDLSLQNWLCDPPSFILVCLVESPQEQISQGMELTIHLHLMPSLWMSLWTFASPYVFMVCTEAISPVHFWTKILHFFHLPDVNVCSHTSSRYCMLPCWWIDSFTVIHDLGCRSHQGYRVMNTSFSERKVRYFKYI